MKKGIITVLFSLVWIIAFVWIIALITGFLMEAGVFHYIGRGREGRASVQDMLTIRFGVDIVILIVIYGAFYFICVRLGAFILEGVSELESAMWKKIAKRKRERKKRKGVYDYNHYKYERD